MSPQLGQYLGCWLPDLQNALQSQTTLRGSGGIHPEIWLQLMSSWPWTHKGLETEFSAETSNRLSIKKKNIALLYDSPVIFQNAIISLCWKHAPAIDYFCFGRPGIQWAVRSPSHAKNCVSHIQTGCSAQEARMPRLGPSEAAGSPPPRVLPGHSLCGLEFHKVMLISSPSASV